MVSNIYKMLEYFITERVPDIKYISLYNNQFNNSETNRAIPLPAVLIEILPINFNDYLSNVQYATVQVNLHLGTPIYNGFDRGDKMQDNSFKHLRLLDKLYIGLNKVNSSLLPDEYKNELFYNGIFKRNSVQFQTYNSIIHTSIISGSFAMLDKSAVDYYTMVELEDIVSDVFYDLDFTTPEIEHLKTE